MSIIRMIEVYPFQSFLLEGASSWTFGLKELLSKPSELEVLVSDEKKAQTLREILLQEQRRGSLDALLQGVGGIGASTGVVAAATAAVSCPLCYVVALPVAPVALTAGALFAVPALYLGAKRMGQRKLLKSLAGKEAKITLYNPEELKEIAEQTKVVEHMEKYSREKALPRKERNPGVVDYHQKKSYQALSALKEKAEELAQQKGNQPSENMPFRELAPVYASLAAKYEAKSIVLSPSPVLLTPLPYRPLQKKSLVFVGLGLVTFFTGTMLYATDTNPLKYFTPVQQEQLECVEPESNLNDNLNYDGN